MQPLNDLIAEAHTETPDRMYPKVREEGRGVCVCSEQKEGSSTASSVVQIISPLEVVARQLELKVRETVVQVREIKSQRDSALSSYSKEMMCV